MQRVLIVLAVIGASVALGSTVFKEQVAWAAQAVDANIIGPLDGNGNIRVHEQGTVASQITGPVDDSGSVVVRESGTWWRKVAENLTVVNGTPFTHTTDWVNVSSCAQILFFARSSFALHPELQLSADRGSVDWTQQFINWTRPGNVGWSTYYPAHLGIRFAWARFNWPLRSTWSDSHMSSVWMVCQPSN